MKTSSLLLIAILLMGCPVFISAQQTFGEDSLNQSKPSGFDYQKGTFHIAIQNFGFGVGTGEFHFSTFSARFGYMITNNDMIFLDGLYSWRPGYLAKNSVELGIKYRRYFGNHSIRPFVQSGFGMGHLAYSKENNPEMFNKYYGVFDIGAGVSFGYKRWKFEFGIQSGYNHSSSGRVNLLPLVGVSFSF
jgi:hypothetical protein